MFAFIGRLFSANTRMPAEVQAQIESEGVIYLARRVAVIQRFSGSVPGLHCGDGVSRTAGALAFTSQRAVTTLAVRSNPAARVVDCQWDATSGGPLKVEISAAGVRLDVDLARVDPSFRGHLSLNYKAKLDDDVLSRLPRTSLALHITAKDVSRALGVRPQT